MIRRCQFSLIDLPGDEGRLLRLPRKRDGTIYHRDPTALSFALAVRSTAKEIAAEGLRQFRTVAPG